MENTTKTLISFLIDEDLARMVARDIERIRHTYGINLRRGEYMAALLRLHRCRLKALAESENSDAAYWKYMILGEDIDVDRSTT